jgi:hypothetical protein
MYQINFPAQLNTVPWTFTGGIKDAGTGDDLDLSLYSWKFEVLDRENCSCVRLTASTDNGKFTTPETGIFQFSFTASDMATLCPNTYDTRLTMTLISDTTQAAAVSVGPLPIICK